MTQEYSRALGVRLRSIRVQQRLTLNRVQEQSAGQLNAAVIGSYERGDRAITVARLAELAEFYGVTVAELLPGVRTGRHEVSEPRLVIDLNKLAQLPTQQAGPLARYAAAIQSQRGDYKDKQLSVRLEDRHALAFIYDLPPQKLTQQLTGWGVLCAGPDPVHHY